MRVRGLGYALGVSAAAAFLSGCGGAKPSMGAGAIPQAPARAERPNSTSYKVVYSFGAPGADDRKNPRGTLTSVGGTLYGTTNRGGTYNYGTVFALTP